MNLSYWQREYKTRYDYIIIGAGIIGLTTAIYTKRAAPKARVLVLEQGQIPMGATTNNAGFACIGSATEIFSDIKKLGVNDALAQVKARKEGLELLLKLVDKQSIDFKNNGNYEALSDKQLYILDELAPLNDLLKNIFTEDTFSITNKDFGFGYDIKKVILNKYEGELNSGKLYRVLSDLAIQEGVEFKFGTKVLSIENYCVNTLEYSFEYDRVAVCANAYTSSLLPEYGIVPARGQVMVYDCIDVARLDAPCHFDEGYYYFRALDDYRLLIGGGRNLNFLGEQTLHLTNTDQIINNLKYMVEEYLFDYVDSDGKVEYTWSGLMAFSPDKKPIVEHVPNRDGVVIGFGCNGMGVALGSGIGKQVSELLLQ